jgi:DNA replication protein DnaC
MRSYLAHIPSQYENVRLSRLKPRPDLHSRQAQIIAGIQAHPDDSYLLIGRNRTGKSHIGWALYRHAVAKRRRVVACLLRDLLHEFRNFEMGLVDKDDKIIEPRVTADKLRQKEQRWTLLLDEFEKARPSEFAAEMLFSVLDAATSFKHQVIVISNFNVEQLVDHWGRIDIIWGTSIMRRLEECNVANFF